MRDWERMKLKWHLIYCSIVIIGIVMMVVGFKSSFDYTKLPDDNPYIGGILMGIGFFGMLLFLMGFEAWMRKNREFKNDYREKEKKERKREERRKRRERRESQKKYRKLEKEKKKK